jgi:protease I
MFAAIVIPGGYAPDKLRMRHAVLDLIRDGVAQGIPVGAIGHGAQVLISAAVVAGRTLTCWPSIAIDIKNAGGLYVDRPVVDDNGVVTARKVDDVRVFAEAILRRITNLR